VSLTGRQLSDTDNTASLVLTNAPQNTVTLRGNGRFWKTAPQLAGTDKLDAFVKTVMGWYGYGARKGSKGASVKRIQQCLIDRGFLDGGADGSFGPKTENAVNALQAAFGLVETGFVDARTLIEIYFNNAG
jgi:peptidoglycan hydrolase-like protein with peptidoglycan-binding domain